MPARHFEVADEESEPITFGYRGKVYRLRGKTPALVILRGLKARLNGETDRDALDSETLEMLEVVFEEGELERLLKTGITTATVFDIASRALSIYNGQEPDDEGEAPPPEPGATTKSGPSSSDSIS